MVWASFEQELEMSGQMIYLGMVLAAFASFIGTLGVVSVWSALGRKPKPAA